MRKISLMMLLMAAILMSFNLSAQPPQEKRGGDHRGPDADRAPIHSLVRAIRHNLELSEQQETAIRAITEDYKAEVKPLMQGMHEGMRALHEVTTADTYDQAAVEAIAADQGEFTRQKIVATSNAAASIMAELTLDQKAELQALKEERQARRHDGKRKQKQGRQQESSDQEISDNG